MDDVWPWLASLPPSGTDTAPPQSLPIAASPDGASIVLQADCTTADNGTAEPSELVAFSLAINSANSVARALWKSKTFGASSPVDSRMQLLAQLLDEVTALSPSIPSLSRHLGDSSEYKLDAEGVSAVVEATTDTHSAAFFLLALLLRLFWLCALEAPWTSGFSSSNTSTERLIPNG